MQLQNWRERALMQHEDFSSLNQRFIYEKKLMDKVKEQNAVFKKKLDKILVYRSKELDITPDDEKYDQDV
jgi:hypothetical protein